MVRSWQRRLFGGVCGGLGERTRLNANLWRSFFVVGTLLTGGALGAVYLAWWWLLPLDSPNRRTPRVGLGGLLALLMLVFVVVGFFMRDSLVSPTDAPLYEPLILLALALVHLYRQFSLPADARRAPFLALFFVLLTLIPIMDAFAVLPSGLYDVLMRSAPALLIFAGVYLLLRDRIGAPVGLVAMGVSVALVMGVASVAVTQRIDQFRTENTITHSQDIAPGTTLLLLDVEMLDTDVEFFSASPDTRTLSLTFVGSEEHALDITYNEGADGISAMRLLEERTSPYPTLTAIGRARLQVEVPTGVAIALTYGGERSTATFDMSALDLERLNVELLRGDVLVSLPVYQPLSPSVAENPGRIAVYDGNLRLVVPDDVGGRFILNRNRAVRPQFDEGRYLLIDDGADGTLQATAYDSASIQLRYTLSVPRGQIRLDTSQED